MHVKFSAVVYHDGFQNDGTNSVSIESSNEDNNNFEINIDLDEDMNPDEINIDLDKDMNPDEINIDLDEVFKNPNEKIHINSENSSVNKEERLSSFDDKDIKNFISLVENVEEQPIGLTNENSPKISQITTSQPRINDEIEDPISCTRFLALDKCLPGRNFLQVINYLNGSYFRNKISL